jgi:hypothetical protein
VRVTFLRVIVGNFHIVRRDGARRCDVPVSAESFLIPLRGYCTGFAAAIGKAGMAIRTQVSRVQDSSRVTRIDSKVYF